MSGMNENAGSVHLSTLDQAVFWIDCYRILYALGAKTRATWRTTPVTCAGRPARSTRWSSVGKWPAVPRSSPEGILTGTGRNSHVARLPQRNVFGRIGADEKSGKTAVEFDDAQVTSLLQKEAGTESFTAMTLNTKETRSFSRAAPDTIYDDPASSTGPGRVHGRLSRPSEVETILPAPALEPQLSESPPLMTPSGTDGRRARRKVATERIRAVPGTRR